MITITNDEFRKIVEYVKSNYGINLIQKRTLIEGRMSNILLEKGFSGFSDYYEYMLRDKSGNAVTTLINKLSTNHTYFMREKEHFDYFRDKVMPYLTSTLRNRDLRIWSAGCSSGEEPYTLAMIISDYLGEDKERWDTRILATDISSKVLESAVKGIYDFDQIDSVPPGWRLNYFKKMDNDKCVINDKIKNEVIFRKFNLMESSFPFKKRFHVIFCRNVMIYFDSETKRNLINRFYEFTEPGGYLFVGHSESLHRGETPYKYVIPAVYRKV